MPVSSEVGYYRTSKASGPRCRFFRGTQNIYYPSPISSGHQEKKFATEVRLAGLSLSKKTSTKARLVAIF
jgi:hypothetical protein